MKFAIVNFKDSFNRKGLKVRPCIITNESSKHIRCMLITAHPDKKTKPHAIHVKCFDIDGYIDLRKTFTVRKEFLHKTMEKVPIDIERRIKQKTSAINQKNYVCHF